MLSVRISLGNPDDSATNALDIGVKRFRLRRFIVRSSETGLRYNDVAIDPGGWSKRRDRAGPGRDLLDGETSPVDFVDVLGSWTARSAVHEPQTLSCVTAQHV
jgi:hypothetical protein